MKKKLLGLFYFILTLLILVGVLKTANWLPAVLQKGLMKEYGSVDEVRTKLHLRNIYVPSYFPQSYGWPPSTILAQSEPFVAIVMEFRNVQTGNIELVISQAAGKNFKPDKKISLIEITEKVSYHLKGRAAVLEVGKCSDDLPCSRVSWKEGVYNMTAEMKSSPFDLLKIAESMLQ